MVFEHSLGAAALQHSSALEVPLILPNTLYLRVLCGSENKQRLFPYTALTDWFL